LALLSPKKTWKEVVDSNLKYLHLHTSYALDCKKWRKLIRGEQYNSDGESGDSGWMCNIN